MDEALIDVRPEIEPTLFIYEPLPASYDEGLPLMRDMWKRIEASGAKFCRMTIVSPEYPKPPYPDGFYLEGWKKNLAATLPTGRQAPFNFPLGHATQRSKYNGKE